MSKRTPKFPLHVLPWTLTLVGAALAPAHAQPADPPSKTLPVRTVEMFTSGVSYIERSGQVDGDATVPLTFRTAQINDILKSMVLLDDTGQVQPVTYGAHDPIGRTLQSFAIDVTQPTSRADLLNKLRGARVSVTTTGHRTITGQIVGVEERTETRGDKSVSVQTLTILTATGMESVPLDEARSIRLLDARLDREFREALTTLAAGSDEQRRAVTLRFAGQGRRAVHVGYVTESPLWKISYRLLLGGAKGQPGRKPYLQGWAMVENTTDDDWQNIHLSLVSGRPVSFIQDLYQPLYLPRPVVAPDVVASPFPQTHGDDMQAQTPPITVSGSVEALTPTDAPAPAAGAPPARNETRAKSAPNNTYRIPIDRFDANILTENVRNSVTAQARGADAGEQYEYDVTTPVTLPRQQAAMIPVVAQDIDGDKILLYNADSDARFPLNAVRLKNTTSLHLKGGPVTLFDDGVYAGDAKMEDVAPGASRLISYAVDLSVQGDRQQTDPSSQRTSLSLKHGVLILTRRERRETNYTLKSQAKETKTVLVEQPYDPQFTLVEPKEATERTASLYRFAVPVASGETQALKVVVERPLESTLELIDADLDEIGVYATKADVPEKLRETLRDVISRRRRVLDLSSQAQQRDAEIANIGREQERIRKNMTALDHASALYKRYVAELDAQETRLQALQTQSQRLKTQAAAAQNALRTYLDGLTLNL